MKHRQVLKLYMQEMQNFLQTDAKVTGFTDNPSLSNPLYEQNIRQLNTGTNLVASKTFVSYLQAHNDPRINDYFLPSTGGTQLPALTRVII